MERETRNWTALLQSGVVPRLIVAGEVCTHPYAQAFLKEDWSPNEEPDTLCLTLTVLADTSRADLKDWTPIRFEKPLLARTYDQVMIAGTGKRIDIDIKVHRQRIG